MTVSWYIFCELQGHDIHMIYQMWGTSSVALTSLRRSATISMFVENFEYLQDVKGMDCEGNPRNEAECYNRELRKELSEKNYTCLPTHFRILQNFTKEVYLLSVSLFTYLFIFHLFIRCKCSIIVL